MSDVECCVVTGLRVFLFLSCCASFFCAIGLEPRLFHDGVADVTMLELRLVACEVQALRQPARARASVSSNCITQSHCPLFTFDYPLVLNLFVMEEVYYEFSRVLLSPVSSKSPAYLGLRSSKSFIVFVVPLAVSTVSRTCIISLLHFIRLSECQSGLFSRTSFSTAWSVTDTQNDQAPLIWLQGHTDPSQHPSKELEYLLNKVHRH